MSWRGRPGRGTLRVAAAALTIGLISTLAVPPVLVRAAAAPRHRVTAAVRGFLNGISCASTTSCMAVGERSTAQGLGGSLTERWNGTTWSVVPSPNPGLSATTRLNGVACVAAANCLAVGNFTDEASGDSLPTAEHWNGTAWSLLSVPDVSGSTSVQLNGIACSGASNCFAAGGSMNDTLIERWNGSAWSIVPSPSPNQEDKLDGVACSSASRCWAVGFTVGPVVGSLTEKWDGTSWSVVHTPSSGDGQLIGDSCPAATDCLATGVSPSSMFAIAQVWNGTTWASAPPEKPAGAGITSLKGVSCPPGGAVCESAGAKEVSSGEKALAERWSGSAWTVQSTPGISGSSLSSLNGVSCVSHGDCWAAGQSDDPSGIHVLIEHWNGANWSVTAS